MRRRGGVQAGQQDVSVGAGERGGPLEGVCGIAGETSQVRALLAGKQVCGPSAPLRQTVLTQRHIIHTAVIAAVNDSGSNCRQESTTLHAWNVGVDTRINFTALLCLPAAALYMA